MKGFLTGALVLCAIITASCGEKKREPKATGGKVNIIATIFPLYDFARAAAREHANIKMLTPPGTSLHSYEPSPADMKSIMNADIFLYIGGESDTWVKRILSAQHLSKIKAVKLFDYVNLQEEEGEESKGESPEYDEHIWTSPKNAAAMITEIAKILCETDSANCEAYNKNSSDYISQIEAQAYELKLALDSAKKREIVVADRFPFLYFVKEYGLDYTAAFPGCSDQSDASAATLANLIKKIKNSDIHYIYYVELSTMNTARIVAEHTGASMLLLHSYQNLSKQEFDGGTTYLDLFKQNAANLKTGLFAD